MQQSVPPWIQVQAVFTGATIGSSWGLCDRPESTPLASLEAYLQSLEAGSTALFQAIGQEFQWAVQSQCLAPQSLQAARHADSRSMHLQPWITTFVATWLHVRSHNLVTEIHRALATFDPPFDIRESEDVQTLASMGMLWQQLIQTPVLDPSRMQALLQSWSTTLSHQQLNPPWAQLLLELELYAQARYSMQQLRQVLDRRALPPTQVAIAIAWYCLLTTPEDFVLSLTRAVRFSPQPELSGLLVGIGSNLYNGKRGFLQPGSPYQPMLAFHSFLSHDRLKRVTQPLWQTAALLFAHWAGFSSPQSLNWDDPVLLTVTTPRPLLLQG